MASSSSYLLAATDGQLGQISSGSIGISLLIPNTKQIHVTPAQEIAQPPITGNWISFCLGITDMHARPGGHDYQFELSATRPFTENSSAIAVIESPERRERIVNARPFTVSLKSDDLSSGEFESPCTINQGYYLHVQKDRSKTLVFTLIPE